MFKFQAPERIVHTERFDDWLENETLVTTLFAEKDGQTTVSMTILYDSRKIRGILLNSPMQEAVARANDNLDNLLVEMT